MIALYMKKFLYTHLNITIGALAVLFIAILAGFYLWAIGDVFGQMKRALMPSPSHDAVGFDLAGASKLDLHGLINGVPPVPISATASALTPTLLSTSTIKTTVTTSPAAASSSTSMP